MDGPSRAGLGVSPSGPKNGRNATTPATANIKAAATKLVPVTHNMPTSRSSAALYKNSLPIKPINGAMPAIDNAAKPAAIAVNGMRLDSPRSTPVSRVPVR